MRVFWTQWARDRLLEIEEFIARDAPDRAESFVLELIEKTEILATYPEAGRLVPEDEGNIRRELVHSGYRIIYRIDEERVLILSVFEGSRLVRGNDLK